jgi:hypothetical protein
MTTMTFRIALRPILTVLATLILSTAANAQLFRAYLAIDGNDANPCTLPAPCRLLPAALAAVADGGEIWMLDSANYNTATVTIGKSVSILAVPGAVGSVVAAGGPAISITAGGLEVSLRNLVIVPLAGGGGTHGASMTGASTLTIENSLFANLTGNGVQVVGSGMLRVANSTFRGINDNSTNSAVWAQNGATVDIVGSRFFDNYLGVYAYSSTATTSKVSVSDSTFAGSTYAIAPATTVAGAVSRVYVTRCSISTSTTALYVYASVSSTAVLTIGSSMVSNAGQGWAISAPGVIETLGNNQFTDYGTTSGSLSVVAPK